MNEYYKIVALARLAGVKGTNEEVYQKFLAACDEAANGRRGRDPESKSYSDSVWRE